MFFVCTLALAYFSHSVKPASSGSVLESAVPAAVPASGAAAIPSTTVPAAPAVPVAPATPASGAAQIPTK
ncbi:MAG: putative preprotein translocase, subunit SecG [Ramlibacter sp.]|nr:putative preprotein translocase, subunit SecG [Ramlibacter sp.]